MYCVYLLFQQSRTGQIAYGEISIFDVFINYHIYFIRSIEYEKILILLRRERLNKIEKNLVFYDNDLL